MKFQAANTKIDNGATKCSIEINQRKCMHITFTLRNQTCPTLQMGNVVPPQKNEVKYI
jgi:hypothetical protein